MSSPPYLWGFLAKIQKIWKLEKLENMKCFFEKKKRFHILKLLLYKNRKAQIMPVVAGRLVEFDFKISNVAWWLLLIIVSETKVISTVFDCWRKKFHPSLSSVLWNCIFSDYMALSRYPGSLFLFGTKNFSKRLIFVVHGLQHQILRNGPKLKQGFNLARSHSSIWGRASLKESTSSILTNLSLFSIQSRL